MNKQNLKSFIKSINIYEIIWLASAIVALIVLSSLFPDLMFEDKTNMLVVIFSIVSIISSPIVEILISKQCRWWCIFSIFFLECADIIILFSLKIYSSALISLLFWIPIEVVTFLKWGKHKDEEKKELTKVKSFSPWISVLVVSAMCVIGFLLGLILSYFPNSEVSYVIAFSNVFEISSGILLVTRNNEQWFAWLGYIICESIVWIMMGHYIMLISMAFMLINTLYGIIKWYKYEKKHNKSNIGVK